MSGILMIDGEQVLAAINAATEAEKKRQTAAYEHPIANAKELAEIHGAVTALGKIHAEVFQMIMGREKRA